MIRIGALVGLLVVLAACGPAPAETGTSPAPAGSLAPGASATESAQPTVMSQPSHPAKCGSATAHVYHLYRLHLLDPCRTVTGVVAGIRSEADGDYHVRLSLDPEFASMLRPANRSYQRGDLVLEPICQQAPTQPDAIGPCDGVQAQVPIPPIGTHVVATGAYVLDEQHNGWAELHPLFEIHPG